MKKTLSFFLCFAMLFSGLGKAFAVNEDTVATLIKGAAEYIYKTVKSPQIGSIGGDWAIIALARSGEEIPDEYYAKYYNAVLTHVQNCKGVLHDTKYTEYSRLILSLSSIGKEAQNVAGYNLVAPILNYEKVIRQGINGPVWALIALDSGDYGTKEIREKYINYILEHELADGGFALNDAQSMLDIDVTAMALTALSNYRDRSDVSAAIQRALSNLSKAQNSSGNFSVNGTENSESIAQLLTALSSLDISYTDSRFVKNGKTLLDALISFRTANDGFSHIAGGETNLMATEQALYSLVALSRSMSNKPKLFDMSDAIDFTSQVSNISINGVIYPQKTFKDISGHKNQQAIEELARRGIINGSTELEYSPDKTMTRAEFATIVVRALGLSSSASNVFSDICEKDWFFSFVTTAYSYGIVNGVSKDAFSPHGKITREQAATMVSRVAKLCGVYSDIDSTTAKNILAEFSDYIKISSWAFSPMAYCYEKNILDRSVIEINPQQAISRGEIAQMLYNLLKGAGLI